MRWLCCFGSAALEKMVGDFTRYSFFELGDLTRRVPLGYRRFFSHLRRDASVAAAGRQNFGLWPKPRAKLKTANEKSLAPRNTERDLFEIIVLHCEHESSPQTKQNSLVKSVCKRASIKILVLGPHMCTKTKIGVSTMISLPQRKFEKHIR